MELTAHMPTQTKPADKCVRVLAIDDDEEFCRIVKDLLEPQGYLVVPLANPVKALEMYTREKENFDLVLLDYYMPGLDGTKTCEWLRKLNPQVRVILCSGADELRLRQLMTQCKLDGYIHKPFRMQEALFTIQEVMARKPN